MLAAIFDLQDVLAGLLRLDAERERAIAVVKKLAVGDLAGSATLRRQLAGPGATRVDRRLHLATQDAHLQTFTFKTIEAHKLMKDKTIPNDILFASASLLVHRLYSDNSIEP